MRRDEAERRCEEIADSGDGRDELLRGYAGLARELEAAEVPEIQGDAWQIRAAETLVEILLREALRELDEAVQSSTAGKLEEAVLGGPKAIEELGGELQREVDWAAEPRGRLDVLGLRRRCLDLRRACLVHLHDIFHAERSQP